VRAELLLNVYEYLKKKCSSCVCLYDSQQISRFECGH
jgi:hypothetical protein